MKIVLAARARPEAGSVVTAMEYADELRRRGHAVMVDDGDFHQAWDGAEVALCHPDDPGRLIQLGRRHRVRLVLLGRTAAEVNALDPSMFDLLVTPSRAGVKVAWDGPSLVVPPLAPVGFWRVCPYGDPDCTCPRSAVCLYEDDSQTGTRALKPPEPAASIVTVGASSRHGASITYHLAKQMPDRDFVVVRSVVGAETPPPPLANLTMVGPYDTGRLRRLYSRTRLLLMPGPQTAGRPALEAAASGIPTIANPSPGARETLGDGAVWRPVEKMNMWVDAIRRLDNPGAYSDAGEAAYRVAALPDRRAAFDTFEATLATL